FGWAVRTGCNGTGRAAAYLSVDQGLVGGGSPSVDPIAELARAAAAGDEDSFRALYREVQPGLLRYLRGLVGDEAEDVASEAWLQIARDLRTFRGDGAGFRGWAASVARHRALDHLRYRHRRPSAPEPDDR